MFAIPLAAAMAPAIAVAQEHPGPGWRPARCVVANTQNEDWTGTWRGPCYFMSDRGGSFSIRTQRGAFPDGTDQIGVTVIAPGQAEVRVITQYGVNARWGPARRSSRDRACWNGDGFSICAY
jgi:hypothetical protein